MLWDTKLDCRNEFIPNAIKRTDMVNCVKCLHLRDNTFIDAADGYYNVRPIFENLNSNCLRWLGRTEEHYSIDEREGVKK